MKNILVAALVSFITVTSFAQGGPQTSRRLVRYVDPFIGTGGHGHTFPGATVPCGMIQVSPDSRNGTWDGCSGYHFSDSTVLGFSHKHLSGTGIGDLGDLLLMPTVTGGSSQAYFPSRFSHENEHAEPGYYSVQLSDHNILVELTATARAGFHRYSLPAAQPLDVVIDLVHGIDDSPTDALLSVQNDSTLVGYRMSTGWARNQKFFFAVQFSRHFVTWRATVNGSPVAALREMRGTNVRGVMEFGNGETRLLVKVGVSAVSIAGALRNLRTEIPHWDFEKTRREASGAWEGELRKFTIRSKNEAAKRVFYTAVYHTLLAPVLFNDVDGSYRGGDGAAHSSPGFDDYHIFSLWDTFRTLHPLFTITQPQRTESIVRSVLAFGREFGLLPVWSFEGNETNTMIGYHSVPVIVDAFMKGVRGIDPAEAFEAMKKISREPRRGLQFYSLQEPKDLNARLAEIRKEVIEPNQEWWTEPLGDSSLFVSGYAVSLSGDPIYYRSLYSDVHGALLVRAQEGKRIRWETQPVPIGSDDKAVTFVWMVGMASLRGAHTFTLRVDGQQWFTFTTSPDGSQTYWKRKGSNGSELVFQAQLRDEFGDLFGHMYLRLPPHSAHSGAPAVIEVQGDSAGSADWYMTFQHSMHPRVRATQEYEMVSSSGRTRQLVKIEVEHFSPPASAVVRSGSKEVARMSLIPGSNTVFLPLDTVSAQTNVPLDIQIGQRHDTALCILKPFSTYGYVPADREGESVSKTLEYAYDDWCIAQMALALNKKEDYAYYTKRAGFYRNLFDSTTGFMRGRNLDGSWVSPFNPLFGTQKQPQYTESNAWQVTWFVPHDVDGLVTLFGGKARSLERLDSLFSQHPNVADLGFPPDISGLIGMYAHGNEPSHHIVYLYSLLGQPWKTQDLVKRILDSLYAPLPDGLCGNDDCGQMSAWYIMGALGFAPVNPCCADYVIGVPHFEFISMDVGNGKRFEVSAKHLSPKNRYVQSVHLNGKPLTGPILRHADVVKGGTLTFTMGDRPTVFWKSQGRDRNSPGSR